MSEYPPPDVASIAPPEVQEALGVPAPFRKAAVRIWTEDELHWIVEWGYEQVDE